MVTAMVSALTGRKVKKDIAMTGEITLSGRVLPVGGIKEKFLAAHRYGVKTIIMPAKNVQDLDERAGFGRTAQKRARKDELYTR